MTLLADSEIRESHVANDRRVQDAYGLRCVPQVHGPVLDALDVDRASRIDERSMPRRTIHWYSRTARC